MNSTPIPTKTCDSWEDFKKFVSAELLSSSSPSQRDRYLFRGHRDEDWTLQPRFDRTFESLPDDERRHRHEFLIDHFRHECHYFPAYKEETKDDLQCTALAQHHGLPTRLLDWTNSPYIAAYFAFNEHLAIDHGPGESGKSKRVAIFVLDRNAKGYWKRKGGVTIVEPQSLDNERQRRQYGWFTYAKAPFRTLEEYVVSVGGIQQKALQKVLLSADFAKLALRDLALMRISARELFPDLDGATKNALVQAVLSD